jgi:hypothetical protein
MSNATGFVVYNPHLESPARGGSLCLDKIRLFPGRNRLPVFDIEKLKSHPRFTHYQELGAIQVLKTEIPFDAEITLDKLSVEDALKIVNTEVDLGKLKTWQQTESQAKKRPGILNGLALRIKDIEVGNL